MRFFAIFFALIIALNGVSVYAAEFSDESYIIETDGTFVDITNSTYKEQGSWEEYEYVGFDNKKVKVSSEVNASALWTQVISPQGKYEVYFWKTVMKDGAKDAQVICASNTDSTLVNVDFSRGKAGWQRLGVVDIPDSFFSVEVRAGEGGGKIAACCYRIVPTDEDVYNFEKIYDENPDAMIFKIGSQTAFYNHDRHKIPDVAPQLYNNTTMLPLRFVSENLGAEVLWDGVEKSVTINHDGHNVVFYIGKNEYVADGVVEFLDEAPQIANSRTLIPMRALCEKLGKEVKWHESGVIVIAESVIIDDKDAVIFYESCNEVFNV